MIKRIIVKYPSFFIQIVAIVRGDPVKDYISLFRVKLQKKFLTRYSDKNLAYMNRLAHIIALNLISTEDFPKKYVKFSQEEKETIDKEMKCAIENKELKFIISDSCRLLSYYFSALSFDELKARAEKSFENAKKYNPDAVPVTRDSFWQLRKDIKERYKKEQKEYSKLLKRFLTDKTHEALPKIEISLQQTTYIFAIAGTIFLLTGYLYNKFFLGFFGIEVSKFFSIADYLSTSVDKIYIACVSVIVATLSYISGMYVSFKDRIADIEFERKFKPKMWYVTLAVVAFFATQTLFHFYYNNPRRYVSLSFLIFIFVLSGIHLIPFDRFFKKPIHAMVILAVFTYFGVYIFGLTMYERDKIRLLDFEKLSKYRFELSNDMNIKIDRCIILSRTSDYFFLYDKEKNRSFVIPKAKIKLFETIDKNLSPQVK